MATNKTPKRTNAWPAGKVSKEETTRALAKAAFLANHAVGNIGDSMESRLTSLYLGGGSDAFDGGMGYNGEFLGQSVFDGEEATQRGAPALSPLSRAGNSRDDTKIAWTKMQVTSNIYDNDGQVSSIVDLMSDFATEGIKFIHSSDTVQKFYDSWSQKVNLKSRFRNAITQLLVNGNVFLYRVFAKLNASEETAMKTFTVGRTVGDKFAITNAKGEETIIQPKIEFDSSVRFIVEAGVSEKEFQDAAIKKQIKDFVIGRIKSNAAKIVDTEITPGAANVVPWKYVMLNPTQVAPDGDGWIYLLTKEDVMKLLNTAQVSYDEQKQSIKVSLPENIGGTLKKSTRPGFYGEMKLSKERLIVLQYNKPDWKKWAIGLVWKAMPTITFKNTLRQMEIKTAKAAINTVILWKLGDHKEGLMPILEDYERLADMLKAPASTLNVIWNSAITADVIQPKLSEVFDVKRWEELRKEVTAQFGITQAVVTGEGGNFSSSFISVQGLLEKLETLRDILIESWLMEEIFIINKAMGFRKLPQVSFGEMSLRDETAANNFAMALYDRGLISDQTLYDTLSKDSEIERERLLNEKKWEEDNKFDRRGPFIKVPEQDQHDNKQLDFTKKQGEKDIEMRQKELDHSTKLDEKKAEQDFKIKKFESKEKMKIKKVVDVHKAKNPPKPNGRPPGSRTPHTNKRTRKPKNVANRADVEKLVQTLDENIKKHLVTQAGVSDFRSLSKDDKEKVTNLVGVALAQLDDVGAAAVADPAFIQSIDVTKYPDSEFATVLVEKATDFAATNNRKANKDEVYKLYIDTYLDS